MRTIRNIYAEIMLMVAFIVPFCVLTYQLIINVISNSLGFVDVMVLIFDVFLLFSIYLQYLTIGFYVRSVREKSHNVAGNK